MNRSQALARLEPPARQLNYQRAHWANKDAQLLAEWDMLDTPPAWLTFEIQTALDAIPPPHRAKKRLTVLRMAEAIASGIGKKSILRQKETCNNSTWYGTQSKDEVGWRNMPELAHALDLATKRAFWWHEREETERMARRQRQLSLAQDEMVDLAGLALETLANLMLNGESERVRREAAEAILDRADVATASKGTQAHDVHVVAGQGPSMAEIRNRERNRTGLPDLESSVMDDGTDPAGHSPAPPPGNDNPDDLDFVPPSKQLHGDNGDESEEFDVVEHEPGGYETLGD